METGVTFPLCGSQGPPWDLRRRLPGTLEVPGRPFWLTTGPMRPVSVAQWQLSFEICLPQGSPRNYWHSPRDPKSRRLSLGIAMGTGLFPAPRPAEGHQGPSLLAQGPQIPTHSCPASAMETVPTDPVGSHRGLRVARTPAPAPPSRPNRPTPPAPCPKTGPVMLKATIAT